ncbi:MAG TPA: hypothetical protein VE715_07305 [Blastocatellia bacterium]|nr:hypothetical protein [Blastocatellia bacterium]
MSVAEVSFEQVFNLAQLLKPSDQARLISQLAEMIENTFEAQGIAPPSRRPLRGLLADLGPAPSTEDIDEARREMWGNFPRDDF